MKSGTLLFIPMYNCEKQILRVIGKIGGAARGSFAEVLVADNGSSDGSVDSAARALAELEGVKATLIRNLENYSLGGSLKIAFNYCLDNGYARCVVLHGDDQADIGDILPCLQDERFLARDCAFGSRFDAGSRLSGYSPTRLLGNRVLNFFATIAGGRRVSDLGSGLNMYKAVYLKDRAYLRFPDGLTFDVYMLLRCLWTRADFVFFPISWSETDQKSNARAFRQGAEILSLLFRYALRPASVFSAGRGGKTYAFEVAYSRAP